MDFQSYMDKFSSFLAPNQTAKQEQLRKQLEEQARMEIQFPHLLIGLKQLIDEEVERVAQAEYDRRMVIMDQLQSGVMEMIPGVKYTYQYQNGEFIHTMITITSKGE